MHHLTARLRLGVGGPSARAKPRCGPALQGDAASATLSRRSTNDISTKWGRGVFCVAAGFADGRTALPASRRAARYCDPRGCLDGISPRSAETCAQISQISNLVLSNPVATTWPRLFRLRLADLRSM